MVYKHFKIDSEVDGHTWWDQSRKWIAKKLNRLRNDHNQNIKNAFYGKSFANKSIKWHKTNLFSVYLSACDTMDELPIPMKKWLKLRRKPKLYKMFLRCSMKPV